MFSGRVASLAVDGTLHFWDPHLTSISTVSSAATLCRQWCLGLLLH